MWPRLPNLFLRRWHPYRATYETPGLLPSFLVEYPVYDIVWRGRVVLPLHGVGACAPALKPSRADASVPGWQWAGTAPAGTRWGMAQRAFHPSSADGLSM